MGVASPTNKRVIQGGVTLNRVKGGKISESWTVADSPRFHGATRRGALSQYGGQQVNRLTEPTTRIERLGDPDARTRLDAYRELERRGSEAVPALIDGLKHGDPTVRKSCAALMDHLADARCIEPLVEALEDPVADVRRLAVHSIGCQGCKAEPLSLDVVGLLIRRATGDESIRVRRVATHMLGNQPFDARALAALEGLCDDPDAKVRSRAAWAHEQHAQTV